MNAPLAPDRRSGARNLCAIGSRSSEAPVGATGDSVILRFPVLEDGSAGTVTARVIVSPGHMKRILAALADNISKYEKTFGTIQTAEEPKAKILS